MFFPVGIATINACFPETCMDTVEPMVIIMTFLIMFDNILSHHAMLRLDCLSPNLLKLSKCCFEKMIPLFSRLHGLKLVLSIVTLSYHTSYLCHAKCQAKFKLMQVCIFL